ncbi:hypothetical protein BASA81_015183 [Batrachochytrium salamandrivorans]|nr:hypothetical protein BASA81_015183 [Batrachochytrium salamandrivorans]
MSLSPSLARLPLKEICQHKGWLLKRGEGYEDEDIGAFPFLSLAVPLSAPSSPTNKIKPPAAAAAAGWGVGGTPGGGALMFESSSNADAVFASLLGGFRGKSEKKRYFKLVTLEDATTSALFESTPQISLGKSLVRNSLIRQREGESGSGQAAAAAESRVELRYYQDEKCDVLKGVITLTADCTLVTSNEDASLVLQTPGRKYYLRPSDGSVTSVTARTISHQWADAIRREVRALFQAKQFKRQLHNNNRASLQRQHSPGMGLGRLLRGESIGMAPEPEHVPQTLGEILANPSARNEFHDFLEAALAIENLLFHEAVDKCKTQQDMESIMQRFVRPGSEHEVNLAGHQRARLVKLVPPYQKSDFDEAQFEIYKLMETNFFKRFYREAVDKTGAFAALYATLGLDGFNLVLQHFGPIKTDLDRLLGAMQCKLSGAEEILLRINREVASSSREVAVREQSTTRRALTAIYHAAMVRMDALEDYVEAMQTEVIAPLKALVVKIDQDLKTIHKLVEKPVGEMESLRRVMSSFQDPNIELENQLEQLETAHTKPMESAMAKLESLELYRIETCREITLYAVMAERNFLGDMARATELLVTASQTVEVNKDIQELAQILGRELLNGIK